MHSYKMGNGTGMRKAFPNGESLIPAPPLLKQGSFWEAGMRMGKHSLAPLHSISSPK